MLTIVSCRIPGADILPGIYGGRSRIQPLLRVSVPFRLGDDEHGHCGQHASVVHFLGNGRSCVLLPDRFLLRKMERLSGRQEGLRDEQGRRRRLFSRFDLAPDRLRQSGNSRTQPCRKHSGPASEPAYRLRASDLLRRRGKKRPVSAPYMVARCHGRPDPCQRAAPFRHHGGRRRLHVQQDFPLLSPLRRTQWQSRWL